MRAKRKGANPQILEFEQALVKKLAALGVPVFAHCVIRERTDQELAYLRGNSKARFGQSAHNYGMAVDIIHAVKGWEIPRQSWEIIGHVGKEVAKAHGIKITWGGDFTSLWDPAHWELEDWKAKKDCYPWIPPQIKPSVLTKP